jgi:hypothetical protein
MNQQAGQGDKGDRVTFAPPRDGWCSAKVEKNIGWEKEEVTVTAPSTKNGIWEKEARVTDSHLPHLPSFCGG